MAHTRPARRHTPSRRVPAAPRPARRRDTLLYGAVAAALLALALAGDDRHVGLIADGRQMIRTAVALVETGEIGQAAGRDFTFESPSGEAVSRFGMAMSLLQVPAAWAAPHVEAALGPGSSQGLFLVLPWLAVGLAAAGAGFIARSLGADDVQTAGAVLLASVASPLGSYALLEFSDPLQAAALTLALAAALGAAQAPAERRGLTAAAGFAAAVAVLAKSSLIIAAPAVLLPLLDPADLRRTRRAILFAGAGALPPLALWAGFEVARFGEFFGGYPDDRFTHPWFDGLWRLLVGPNRGILLFWPALLLFVWVGVRLVPHWRTSAAARGWAGAGLAFAAQLAVAAGYWGWHGMEGWGPRLLLAALPALAPFAAIAPLPRAGLLGVIGLCVALNLPPLLQHPTPVATYVMNLAWPEIPESARGRYPFYATTESPRGQPAVVPFEELDAEPAANPWRTYAWMWRASRLDDEALAAALMDPPWSDARPHLLPAQDWTPSTARLVVPPPRLGFLGRSLTGTGGPYATVYLDALLDQVVRAHQRGRIALALAVSARRLELSADGEAAAWRLETLRRAGRALDAEALLDRLPRDTRAHPLINVVLALFDRDFGEEERARALLDSVAAAFPGAPVQQALSAPLSEWPVTLDAMIRAPRRDAVVGADR